MDQSKQIGTVIAKLRKAKGVTQVELANFVGVSPQAVSKWETGGVPDTELLPKIADFFDVPIDFLFARDYAGKDIAAAICERIRKYEYRSPRRYAEAFELCWTLERSLFTYNGYLKDEPVDFKHNTIADYQNRLAENEQTYSSNESDYGFTRMGIANRLQYFLMVPEIKDKELALFSGINYPEFFAYLSDRDVFQALLLLFRRDERKSFTESLFVKELSVDTERAKQLVGILKKMNLIRISKLELDDETRDVYTFVSNTAFIALLIFAREMIDRPSAFSYQSGFRTKPYLD